MTIKRAHIIIFLAGLILGLLAGFFTGKGMYDTPEKVKIERDTVSVTDTIVKYKPKPVEVEKVRTEYKWLVRAGINTTDTVTMHDSVLVEVPITSKHYHAQEYDAWVSGYLPSLDSIRTYNKTEYITETITRTKQASRLSVGLQGGYGYGFKAKALEPYVGIGLTLRLF